MNRVTPPGAFETNPGDPNDPAQTFVVATPDLAGRLVGKRVTSDHFRHHSDGIKTCDVVLGWGLGHELLDGFETIGWQHGYGDIVCRPDKEAERPMAWWPNTTLVMADAVQNDSLVAIAPRTILRRQADAAEALGFGPWMASELEFTVFDESADSLSAKRFTGLNPHGAQLHPELVEQIGFDEDFLLELRIALLKSGIPVESVKSEYSRGQFEMVVSPGTAMESADRHVTYKLAVREIARRHGLSATFMAKWHESYGGSSCHIHISLNDADQRNAFASGREDELRHFVAGVQRYARDVFLLWAPYHNSYKRFRDGSFAPTALGWGDDNRTAALRVTGAGAGRHLENRIPGADVNPYLAYAGLLSAGLAGIVEKLEPVTAATEGNAYKRGDQPRLPRQVEEAIDIFSHSEFARKALGADVVDHITNFCEKEAQTAHVVVTDWDRRRLFDV